jgi:N-acetylglucosaminyldiphosphoundecaprenol N-acetyl-beta-D-mannosaminyltransferase
MVDISIPKTKIALVEISKCNLQETLDLFCSFIDNNKKKRICVTPVNNLVWANRNKKLLDLYNTSDMNLPDGVPLLWASKFLKDPIKGRVTGLDLLPAFSAIAEKKNYSFFLLGAKEGVAQSLSEKLREKHPSLKIVGVYSPPFAERFSDEENEKMIEMINKVKPNVLWVSLTAPKQDYWIQKHITRLDTNIAVGVGGAFEVTAGIIKRAPRWMQKNGLEWLYRFFQEPRRLFRRYFIEAPKFFYLIFLQKLGLLSVDHNSYLNREK